jgi:hypothetical protein
MFPYAQVLRHLIGLADHINPNKSFPSKVPRFSGSSKLEGGYLYSSTIIDGLSGFPVLNMFVFA